MSAVLRDAQKQMSQTFRLLNSLPETGVSAFGVLGWLVACAVIVIYVKWSRPSTVSIVHAQLQNVCAPQS